MDNNTTVSWYDANSDKYHNGSKGQSYEELYSNFMKLIQPGGKILDSGCGPGRDSKFFSDQGFEVVGIDLSEGLLKIATEFAPKVKFQSADIRELPFEKESFGGVWSMASLLHLDSLEGMAEAIDSDYRVLKAGGVLHIVSAFKYDDTRKFTTEETPVRSFLRVTPEELSEMCTKAGFKTITSTVLTEDKMRADGRPNVQWVYYLGQK